MIAERTFDPAVDLYLADHTLGRNVSTTQSGQRALAIMPLTMSLEILAEAAASLVPGTIVVGLRDAPGVPLDRRGRAAGPLEYRRGAFGVPGSVVVQLRNLSEDAESAEPARSPVLEATVLLADTYPGTNGSAASPGQPATPRWSPGPPVPRRDVPRSDWQGVTSVDETGDDGTIATLRVLPFDRLLRDVPAPRFALDPVVLDAAGQVIGFWTMDRLPSGKVIFPFRVAAIDLYGPHRPRPNRSLCRVDQLLGDQVVRSDIDVSGADGRLWMHIQGWEDRRFDLPDRSIRWCSQPVTPHFPTTGPRLVARLTGPGQRPLRYRLVPPMLQATRLLGAGLGRLHPSPVEREQYRALRTPAAPDRWLAGNGSQGSTP